MKGYAMSKSIMVKVLVILAVFLASIILPSIPIARAQKDDFWISRAPLNENVYFPKVAVVNNRIYAISKSATEEYNPETNMWTSKTPMPTPREDFAIAAYKNKIYVIGGHINLYSIGHSMSGINEVYDPQTDTWETKKSMPTPRCYLRANTVENKIYLVAGYNNIELGPPSYIPDINEVYYPETDTWTIKAPMPNPVYAYASAIIDKKIYFFAGGPEESDLNQIYNTETDSWSLGKNLPSLSRTVSAIATTGTLAPKRIYVIGGSEGFAFALNLNRIYDPVADEWSDGAPMITSRYAVALAVIDDFIYAIGGGEALNSVKTNEQYIPKDHILADTIVKVFPTPTPYEQPEQTDQDMIAGAILAVTSIAVFLGLLVFFIKRR